MTDAKREIEQLEHAFWQSMVDNTPKSRPACSPSVR